MSVFFSHLNLFREGSLRIQLFSVHWLLYIHAFSLLIFEPETCHWPASLTFYCRYYCPLCVWCLCVDWKYSSQLWNHNPTFVKAFECSVMISLRSSITRWDCLIMVFEVDLMHSSFNGADTCMCTPTVNVLGEIKASTAKMTQLIPCLYFDVSKTNKCNSLSSLLVDHLTTTHFYLWTVQNKR